MKHFFSSFLILAFFSVAAWAASPRSALVVIHPENACVPSDRAYAKSLCKHIVRWYAGEGVGADLADDRALEATLAGRKMAILVLCNTPSPASVTSLQHFVARGGRILSFYSSSPALAKLMGVSLVGYKKPAAGTFSEMALAQSLPGAPNRILQSSPNIFAARAIPKRARQIGVWLNRAGESTREDAIIASAAGWWVTHVFTADGDETAKVQFLLATLGEAVPGSWNAAAWQRKKAAARAADIAYGRAQVSRPGEIRAVWDHSGQGLYPGNWKRTMALLRANGITDIFVNVCGAGFAHYPSRVLPMSSVVQTQGDQLAAALAAARGTGIRVHAWMICFNATRGNPTTLATFNKRGWRLKGAKGELTTYLNPADAAVRNYLLAAIDELVRAYPIHGVHLDFVRWYEKSVKPKDAARVIAGFVAMARNRVKGARPQALFTTATLGFYPSCIQSVGQDWVAWLDAGIVDFTVPMNYTENTQQYAKLLAVQGSTRARAHRIISGIGVTANESRLSARQTIDQIRLAREVGCAGIAFFDLDHTLVTDILPILREGIFK